MNGNYTRMISIILLTDWDYKHYYSAEKQIAKKH